MGIKSLEELRSLRSSLQGNIELRAKGENTNGITTVLVGMSTCGIASGARDTFNELLSIIEEKKLDNVRVISVGCIGSCSMEPTVQINMHKRESIIYGKITKEKVSSLIQKVIIEKGYLEENLIIQSFEKVEV